jgi:hypothetical protein
MVDGPWELKNKFKKHISSYNIDIESPYGDGYSSIKICDIFENKL